MFFKGSYGLVNFFVAFLTDKRCVLGIYVEYFVSLKETTEERLTLYGTVNNFVSLRQQKNKNKNNIRSESV